MSEPVPVILPQVNVNDDSVLMVQWLVERGAAVSAGDEICIVETTKAATSLACDQSGVIVPLAEPGTMVPVGSRIGMIGESVDAIDRALEREAAHAAVDAAAGASSVRATPKAEALARQHGIALEAVAAMGVRGTIKESDVQRLLDERTPAAPAARAVRVQGSTPLPAALASLVTDGGPVSKHDLAVVHSLRASLDRVLLATVTTEIDLDAVNRAAQAVVDSGTLATPLHVVLVALGRVLPRFPRLTTFIHDDRYYRYVKTDVALVVRTPDGKLFTPALRDLPAMELRDVARACQAYAVRAARGKLSAEDLAGAAFAVSHVNVPVEQFFALPNSFNSAILAMAGQRQAVRVVDGAPAVATVASLTLTYDHAVCDGQYAAEFLTALAQELDAITV